MSRTGNARYGYSHWKRRTQLLRTLIELVLIIAHRCTPRLPPIAMVAPFVSFIRYFYFSLYGFPFSSYTLLLKPLRLFVAIQALTPTFKLYTVLYAVIWYPIFQLIRLSFSLYGYCSACISAYTVARFYSLFNNK